MVNGFKLPRSLTEEIFRLTEGNPFFIEEVLRSLIDQGIIVRKEWGIEVTAKTSTFVIPSTITKVLMARIDRLDEESRQLLKVASVIGRSFSSRILSQVAGDVKDIEDRLSFLSHAQLVKPQERMGEVFYVFRHALAQEAVYDSILPARQRDLHLKVAHAIENVFCATLQECYGMLAYHYGRADHRPKTEEYLIKAGEEALRSAASDEALHYYSEALRLHKEKSNTNVDPDTEAMLEKNIGNALFNRGRFAEAVDHFCNALNYLWGVLPRDTLSGAFRSLPNVVRLLLAIYFPSLWFKKQPRQRDFEAIDLLRKTMDALIIIKPSRWLITCLYFLSTIVHYDLTELKFGYTQFAGASTLFSYTGLSFTISRKILDHVKPLLKLDDARQVIAYDLLLMHHLFFQGRWDEISAYSEDLVNRNLRVGEVFYAAQYCYWHGLVETYKGNFDAVRSILATLIDLSEAYENDIYRLFKNLLRVQLTIESRLLREATVEASCGIDLVLRNGWHLSTLSFYSFQAMIHLLANEMEEAGAALDKADGIKSAASPSPIQQSFFYRSQFEYHLRRLENALRTGNREDVFKYFKIADKSGKNLFEVAHTKVHSIDY